MSSRINLKQLGERLHERLLSGSSLTVTSEIAELFLPAVAKSLAGEFSQLNDPHLIDTAAGDALLSYFARPSQFDPARAGLFTYLRVRAKSYLLNSLAQKKIFSEKVVELDGMETVYKAEDTEAALLERESRAAIMRELQAMITDPTDFQVLSLMLEGVHKASAFAEVLGILDLPLDEQARVVKQHKDRIKKAVRRKMRRERQP